MGGRPPSDRSLAVVTESVRVGTRKSALALRQTELVVSALRREASETRFLVVPITTQGDRSRSPSQDLDFTDAIDRALEEGRIDLAVHSTKDLPARPTRAVSIAAFPRRADPRDCLVLRDARGLRSLPPRSRIGSSSPRRRAQLWRARRDLDVVEIRGNVDTRLALVRGGRVDGVILAAAGLRRIGRWDEVTEVLDRRRFLPAPGQGALAVATRASDRALESLVRPLDDRKTRAAVTAERTFVERIGGDCDTPLGALATVRGNRLTLRAEILSPDGRRSVGGARSGAPSSARALGGLLARDLLRAGAESFLAEPPPA